MQRWFFADEHEVCVASKGPSRTVSSSTSVESEDRSSAECERYWSFCVAVQEPLAENELVAVTGNCESLGNWSFSKCVIMCQCKRLPGTWYSNILSIPCGKPTEYRYLIVAQDFSTDQIIVRRWETHLKPRVLAPQAVDRPIDESDCKDVFGIWEEERKVDRGWLTSETYVQLTFVHAPFAFKPPTKQRQLLAKVTPMRMKPHSKCNIDPLLAKPIQNLSLEHNFSNDELRSATSSSDLSSAFAFCESATLNADKCEFVMPPKWGVPCGAQDIVVFHLTLGDFDRTAYMINLYTYSSKAADDEPPYHFGYHYVQPRQVFKHAYGHFKVPMTCASTHRTIGFMQVNYLIMRPIKPPMELSMQTSYMCFWNPKYTGVEVGHRGCGPTHVDYDGLVRENTIYSLKRAADAGADMIEVDVHLTKDLVPVLYHDFMFYLAMKPRDCPYTEQYNRVPLCNFTLSELQHLRVSKYCGEGYFWQHTSPVSDDEHEHYPFPPLDELFDIFRPKVAFCVEVKWAQRMADKSLEQSFSHHIDPNVYADCMLDVVLRRTTPPRRMLLASFDVNMCLLLRYKQNLYPVLLANGGYMPSSLHRYCEPRMKTFETTIYTALANQLIGIAVPSEDLLAAPSLMVHFQNAKKIVFVWGLVNRNMETIQLQIDMGVHLIMYDRIDLLLGKALMRSIFQIEDAEVLPQIHEKRKRVRHKKKLKGSSHSDLSRHQ